MGVPVDAEDDEVGGVDEQFGHAIDHRRESTTRRRVQTESGHRDDDGEDAVTEGLEPTGTNIALVAPHQCIVMVVTTVEGYLVGAAASGLTTSQVNAVIPESLVEAREQGDLDGDRQGH